MVSRRVVKRKVIPRKMIPKKNGLKRIHFYFPPRLVSKFMRNCIPSAPGVLVLDYGSVRLNLRDKTQPRIELPWKLNVDFLPIRILVPVVVEYGDRIDTDEKAVNHAFLVELSREGSNWTVTRYESLVQELWTFDYGAVVSQLSYLMKEFFVLCIPSWDGDFGEDREIQLFT